MVKLICYVMIPLIFSNILHMVVVKKEYLSVLSIPIAERQFGKNKTWRGIFVVIILNALLQYFINTFMNMQQQTTAFNTGALLGFVYVLFELPNSWIKRRLGIKSGEKSPISPRMFMLMDKMDSALGVSILSTIIFGLTTNQGVLFFIVAVAVHIFFSILLVALGIKKSF